MIETRRLIIRNFMNDDAKDLFEYLSLPEIYKFEPGEPIGRDEAVAEAMRRASSNIFNAVELKSEKKLIGHIYFSEEDPKEFMGWEIGYIFNPKYQNKGYCTEAVIAFINNRRGESKIHRINAYCNPANIASWHVLENCGLRREGYFEKKACFRNDENDNPIWNDSYAYGILMY